MGALSHIRVLDMSRILAGPWAGQLLADMGADVIKIERPQRGDDTRGWGPPFLKDERGEDSSEAAYYLCANRNKRSVAVDITSAEGQELIRALARGSDVVLENYKAGGLARYGLDYESLKAENPRLIYCSITGFGQDGPYHQRAGYDLLVQAMSGLMSVTGERDGAPGGGPQKVGVAVTDILTGLYASNAILAALVCRDQTGVGQYIDMALLDVQVACMANQALNYLTTGEAPRRLGSAHPNIVPYQPFVTADGHLVLAVGNDDQFSRFCAAAGCPSLAADARFATNRARVAHRDRLLAELEPVIAAQPTQWWIDILETVGVPCGPINNLEQVFANPQVQSRGLKLDLPHPSAGRAPGVACPIRFSATPVEYRRGAPLLGQHTDEVLRELLEMSPPAIRLLREKGAIG